MDVFIIHLENNAHFLSIDRKSWENWSGIAEIPETLWLPLYARSENRREQRHCYLRRLKYYLLKLRDEGYAIYIRGMYLENVLNPQKLGQFNHLENEYRKIHLFWDLHNERLHQMEEDDDEATLPPDWSTTESEDSEEESLPSTLTLPLNPADL